MMHNCGKYHYGTQSVVRPCCVEYCAGMARLAITKALTDQHPAYREYIASYNSLTDAEIALVPNVYYAGANLGVIERSKSEEVV